MLSAILSAILDDSHYQNSQKHYYGSRIQAKTKSNMFGSIFNSNMFSTILSAILYGSHYQKSQKEG